MAIDWSVVKANHIFQACQLYDEGKELPPRPARNTFLVLHGKKYPAKHIRGLAYRLATGRTLNPSVDYSGGLETVKFFRNLGFDVEYSRYLVAGDQARRRYVGRETKFLQTSYVEDKAKPHTDPQKEALWKLLQELFGYVVTEAQFGWLVVPDRQSMDHSLAKIVDALASHRNYQDFYSPGKSLSVDYFIPSIRLIVEYDERQHFTIPRSIALRNYPEGLGLIFDTYRWIQECEAIRAINSTPYYRDEQRAFYDSVRDILAIGNGMTIVRIKEGDFDWTDSEAKAQFNNLLSQALEGPRSHCKVQPFSKADNVSPSERPVERRTNIVTICVQGSPLESGKGNAGREKLLEAAVAEIVRERWTDIHVILLPGGFFYFEQSVGPLAFDVRVQVISQKSFHNVCIAACNSLANTSPGTLIVAGVDSAKDQLCIAWSAEGIVGIGRKVFPTSEEGSWYVPHREDYRTDKRICTLPNARRAMLCACYDMFGYTEGSSPGSRMASIRKIADKGSMHCAETPGPSHIRSYFRNLRKNCVADFLNMLAKYNVSVGLAAIHTDPSRYWQVHGIQACSAALNGGLAVGAAHFTSRLPQAGSATLFADAIPRGYLFKKPFNTRRAVTPPPRAWIKMASTSASLIRLFEA